jgi:hypothetical protein
VLSIFGKAVTTPSALETAAPLAKMEVTNVKDIMTDRNFFI